MAKTTMKSSSHRKRRPPPPHTHTPGSPLTKTRKCIPGDTKPGWITPSENTLPSCFRSRPKKKKSPRHTPALLNSLTCPSLEEQSSERPADVTRVRFSRLQRGGAENPTAGISTRLPRPQARERQSCRGSSSSSHRPRPLQAHASQKLRLQQARQTCVRLDDQGVTLIISQAGREEPTKWPWRAQHSAAFL